MFRHVLSKHTREEEAMILTSTIDTLNSAMFYTTSAVNAICKAKSKGEAFNNLTRNPQFNHHYTTHPETSTTVLNLSSPLDKNKTVYIQVTVKPIGERHSKKYNYTVKVAVGNPFTGTGFDTTEMVFDKQF